MKRFYFRFIALSVVSGFLIFSFNNCGNQPTLETISDANVPTGSRILEASRNSEKLPVNSSPFSNDEDKWVKGRILVQPQSGVSDDDLDKSLVAHGGKRVSKIAQINVHVVELPENANEKAVAALLAHNPKFKFAEVDRLVRPSYLPNDPGVPSSWQHFKIGSDKAWDLANGSGITIAILDTGVNPFSDELASKMVPGYNFYDNNTNTADVQSHGSIIASLAAGLGDNNFGAAGVAYNAKIMPMRICDANSWGSWSAAASSITWAADRGARIASMSFGGMLPSSAVQSAADYMASKGGITVVSSGNQGVLDSTSNHPAIIVVSATDSGDNVTSWSTYGPIVDLTAPGAGIVGTDAYGNIAGFSGTSAATPVVSGVIALMMSANSSLTGKQAQNILFSTAVDVGASGRDDRAGYGRVDAYAAVLAAKGTVGTDNIAPSISVTSPASGSRLQGAVDFTVSASDNIGVTRVEYYLNGNLFANSSSAPFSVSFNSASVSDGSYTLQAKAFDAAGNTGSSSSVNFSVDNFVDTIAPLVTILKPASGIRVSGQVAISATASDNEGVVQMRLYINNTLKSSMNGASLSYNWNTKKDKGSGTYTIRVEALDATGNVGSSSVQVVK